MIALDACRERSLLEKAGGGHWVVRTLSDCRALGSLQPTMGTDYLASSLAERHGGDDIRLGTLAGS